MSRQKRGSFQAVAVLVAALVGFQPAVVLAQSPQANTANAAMTAEAEAQKTAALASMLLPSLTAQQPITIEHVEVGCVEVGKFPRFEVRLAPADSVVEARVVFRAETSPTWYWVPMAREGTMFRAILPRPEATLGSMRYYISVADRIFGETRTLEYQPLVVSHAAACPPNRPVAAGLSWVSQVSVNPGLPPGFSTEPAAQAMQSPSGSPGAAPMGSRPAVPSSQSSQTAVALAQAPLDLADAMRTAETDADRDISGIGWFAVGCLLGVLGIVLAYALEPTPQTARLMGRSPEYASAYGDAWKKRAKGKRTKNTWIGCGVGVVAELVFYFALIATEVAVANSQD